LLTRFSIQKNLAREEVISYRPNVAGRLDGRTPRAAGHHTIAQRDRVISGDGPNLPDRPSYRRRQEEAFERFGLNRGEVGVLGALLLAGTKQQLTPTQLFKGLMLSSAGITSRLDRLEKRGYVKRSRHPDDRRGVLVGLTEAGRKILDEAVASDAGGEQQLLAALTREDRRALTGLLRKMLGGLEPTEETPSRNLRRGSRTRRGQSA
jgi:DNA-binding MarR family transcriptional regulator